MTATTAKLTIDGLLDGWTEYGTARDYGLDTDDLTAYQAGWTVGQAVRGMGGPPDDLTYLTAVRARNTIEA
jgi:hypothetical protein